MASSRFPEFRRTVCRLAHAPEDEHAPGDRPERTVERRAVRGMEEECFAVRVRGIGRARAFDECVAPPGVDTRHRADRVDRHPFPLRQGAGALHECGERRLGRLAPSSGGPPHAPAGVVVSLGLIPEPEPPDRRIERPDVALPARARARSATEATGCPRAVNTGPNRSSLHHERATGRSPIILPHAFKRRVTTCVARPPLEAPAASFRARCRSDRWSTRIHRATPTRSLTSSPRICAKCLYGRSLFWCRLHK